MPTVK